MKKMAISVASVMYKLEPQDVNIESAQRVAFVQDAAAALLQQSSFLRDGLDENVSACLKFIPFCLKNTGENTEFCSPRA